MPPRARSTDADAETASTSQQQSDSPRGAESADKDREAAAAKIEDKPSGTEYLNVTTGPLVFTTEGHMVGGGEWTPAVNLDRVGRQMRDRGYLKPRSAL